MKFTFFFILFFSYFCSLSQNIGYYEVNVSGIAIEKNNAECETKLYIELKFNNAPPRKIVDLNWFPEYRYFPIQNNSTFSIPSTQRINELYFFATRGYDNCDFWAFKVCCKSIDGDSEQSVSFPYNYAIYNSKMKNFNSFGRGLSWDNITITALPKLTITTPSGGDLPSKDKIKIESHIGFAPNEYNWEVDTNDGNTFTLEKYKGLSTIEVNAYDVLGEKTPNYIGKFITIKQYSIKGSINDKNYSNAINLKVLKSLPILKNDNNKVIITNCYGDKADCTLQFDRPLKEGEKMSFNIKGVNVGNPNPSSYVNVEALDKDNTFTFKDLEAGIYAVSYIGNSSANTYTPYTDTHPFIFTIKNPDPVRFLKVSTPNPSCNGTSDGQIVIGAFGGTENNYKIEINGVWHNFSSRVTHVFKNLREGIYTIRVKDGNGCIAKLRDTNRETITIELKDPDPITISYPPDRQKLPSFNGASDGYITAVIKGGTPLYFGEKKYNFVWENAKRDTLTNTDFHYDSVTKEFSVILRSVREGNYFLSVYDQNYERNNDERINCAKLRSQYYLSHPEKLKATIELSNPISCNSQNEFGNERDRNLDGQRDESQDGELKIEASGGTPFTGTQNGGKPYIYTWKKQDNNGNWVTLPIQDDTAKNLSAGKYAINIQDANGIVLGEYNTHTVTKVVDVVYELKEPAKLTLSLQKTDATCKGNDGKITATPTGGTPPYTYLWSNGATTASIENLLPMPYTVEIKDGAGCMVQGSTAVLQPNSLTVTGTITPLRCHNANNAAIALAVQGGTAPYQYLWNTGATTANINNLPSGEYKVKITDAQGCAHFKTFTIENPSKFEIDLGENRTLCNGQTLTLNIAINDPQATYLWTGDNGFSSNMPQVTLSEKGTYRATVTTKDGCTATDAITIESANTQIASEFLLTTQAYENEEVILVNTSNPKGETTEWLVPENQAIEITNKSDDYISLIFKAKGEYRIGIKQTQGNCFELFYKNIIVEPATDLPKTQKTNEAFVREFEVAPNPNDGKFKAKVVLEKAGAIKFRLYSITGQLVSEKNSASATEHWVDFQDPLPAATYILVLETPYQRLSKKIIIIP